VGNASDTQASVSSENHISCSDLHEKAKLFINAGNFSSALPMAESTMSAQVRRFSPLHPSIGAAMRNVGVSCSHDLAVAQSLSLFE
jgi:hypothetical protein